MAVDGVIGAAAERVDREALVRAALPLVQSCVASVAARVPRHVRHDELVSAGMLGLAQAARSWDPRHGVPFGPYARRRIEGALLDELRSRDWASRAARQDSRRLHVVTDQLTSELGRAPETAEIARELGVSEQDVERIRDDGERATVLHLDAFEPGTGGTESLEDEPATDPVHQLLGRELRGELHDAVLMLPERLRKVVVDYFFEDRPMKDIATDLGVTISRISHLRADAIARLRAGMNTSPDSTRPTDRQLGCRAAAKAS